VSSDDSDDSQGIAAEV
jgi:hypothetical protein